MPVGIGHLVASGALAIALAIALLALPIAPVAARIALVGAPRALGAERALHRPRADVHRADRVDGRHAPP